MERYLRRSRLLLNAIALLIVVVAWAVTLLYADQQRRNVRTEMEREILQVAQSLAETSSLSLNMADQTLLRLREQAEEGSVPAFSSIAQALSRKDSKPEIINRAAYIGRDGLMLANFQDGLPAPLLDVRDREYFKTFLDKPQDRIFITEPILGKASKRWIVLFARPVFKHGRFDGVVFVGFETSALTPLFTRNLRQGLMVSLLSPEGRVITRTIDTEKSSGVQIGFDQLPEPGELSLFVSPIDQRARLSTVAVVPGWGMRIHVGFDMDTLQTLQAKAQGGVYIPAAVLTVLLLGVIYLLHKSLLHLHASQRTIHAELALNQAILASSSDGVMITDAAATIVMVNEAFAQIHGTTVAALLDQKPNILRSQRHDDDFYKAIWQDLKHKGRWSGRVWNRHHSGNEICLEQTISAVPGPTGGTVRYLSISRDITAQVQQEQNLWQQANFDPLTGLANRTRFEDRLNHVLAQSERHQSRFAIAYLDLDRFKQVNDNLGHAAGDDLLRQLARRLTQHIRQEDTLARLGGDEFALIMPRIDTADDVTTVIRKLIAITAVPFSLTDEQATIGLSVGISLYPEDGCDADTMLKAADQCLYQAKEQGRGRYCFSPACGACFLTQAA